ncbi:MAG: hypothetical protein IKL09_01155 [Clostridia bacterium]|nr:hypothetical protein [Clostridia bacterium]
MIKTRKILFCITFVIVCLLCGCSVSEQYELTSEQQAIIDQIWNNKSTWQKVESGFNSEDCNSVRFGEYNGKTVLISRYVGEKSQFTSAAILREDCYIVTESSFYKMDSWDEMHYLVGFTYGDSWSSSYDKSVLEKIYIEYLKNK